MSWLKDENQRDMAALHPCLFFLQWTTACLHVSLNLLHSS